MRGRSAPCSRSEQWNTFFRMLWRSIIFRSIKCRGYIVGYTKVGLRECPPPLP
jgi:hypothetical protein